MELVDLASWLGVAVRVLVLVAAAVLAIVFVRRGAPATAWALVAAAAVEAVATLTNRMLWFGTRWLPYELMEPSFAALSLFELVQTVLLGALGAVAVWLMGRDARRTN